MLLQYYFVLQSTTPYYKVLLQYYFVLQPYYKVLLQYYSVLQTYYSVLQSTTPTETKSERRPSSTTPYYKVLLQYCFVLQSTTPVLLRTTKYYSRTTPYYKRTTPVLLQYYSVLQSTTPVLLLTTKYYSSTTPYYKVLLGPKRRQNDVHPVLLRTKASKTSISREASSTFQRTSFQNEHFVRGFLNFSKNKLPKRAFRARLPQLFKEQASKTSISCVTSSIFQARSFQNLASATQNAKMTSHLESLKRQNEHFVRDFLQIPHFQLENRRFRATFSYKAIFTKLKKYDFCEASATFQDTHELLRLPRYLKECHVCASLPMRFVEIAPSPRHKMLVLPGHCERPPQKVLRLPRKNDALALRRFQSIAPVTQNTKTTSHFVTWERQKEHFVRDFLHFSYFEGQDGVAVRVYRPIERN